MANHSKFRNTAERCVDLYLELQRLENGKLDARHFLADALAIARCNEKRLDEIEAAIARHPSLTSLDRFMVNATRAVVTANYKRALNKPAKAVSIWGDRNTAAEIAALPAVDAEILAVAVRRAVNRHPEGFGSISMPWPRHEKAIAAARDEFEMALGTLRQSYTPNDLEFGDVTEEERGRGLVRLRLKIAPSVNLGDANWPMHLIRYLIARRDAPEQPAEPTPAQRPAGRTVKILDAATVKKRLEQAMEKGLGIAPAT